MGFAARRYKAHRLNNIKHSLLLSNAQSIRGHEPDVSSANQSASNLDWYVSIRFCPANTHVILADCFGCAFDCLLFWSSLWVS